MRRLTRRTAMMAPVVGLIALQQGAKAQTPAASAPRSAAPAKPAAASAAAAKPKVPDTNWAHYGGTEACNRYAPLDQINAGNFNDLEIAWRFKPDNFGSRPEYQFEPTPLVVNGRMYLPCGSRRDVVALDPANGEVLWLHRLDEGDRARNAPRQLSGRGVSYWEDPKTKKPYIFYVTIGYRLVKLDADTGIPVSGFGVNGVVDLKLNDDQVIDLNNSDIGLHSTPLVMNNVVVVGAAHLNGDVPKTHANVKGYVRGFDPWTGKRKWIFHTIPKKGEFGYDSWLDPKQADEAGNAGVWAQIAGDPQLGLVYLGVESPTGDYNGGFRHGNGLFGESIVAVDVQTGKRRWHYQLVRHGVWDRDIPCSAILCDVHHDGKVVKALAQPTKQAFLYVLNRETGEPLWPIVETPVPKGDVPGEWYSPTQPIPSKPPAYDRQGLSVDDLIDFTPELRAQAEKIIARYNHGHLYTPPTLSTAEGKLGTLTTPGINGGSNRPGGSCDPETGIVYLFSQTQIFSLGQIKNNDPNLSDYPYLSGHVGDQLRPTAAMGGAAPLTPRARSAEGARIPELTLTVQGLPILKPPYGRISAIDLNKGEIAWGCATCSTSTPHSSTTPPATTPTSAT